MEKRGYTRSITYYANVKGLGWMFQSFKTTEDAVKLHLQSLYKQQVAGTVRAIETIRLQ